MKSEGRCEIGWAVSAAEDSAEAGGKRYESPTLVLYGTLFDLTRDSNVPPPGDLALPGSAGGS